MRNILTAIIILGLFSCNKDKFSDEPQISFIKFDRNNGSTDFNESPPHIIFEVRDGNGDLGFKTGKDTSKIYIKNLLTNKIDSLLFPDISSSATKNFKAEVSVSLIGVMAGRDLPSSYRPYQDTIFFELYVTDFAKNKSNVIVTDKPFIFYTLP